MHEMFLIAVVALPFVGSCIAVFFRTNARNAEAYLAAAIALFCLVLILAIYPQVVGGGVLRYSVEWIPTLGLEFTLRIDGFSWALAALITGIGFLVVASILLVPARIHGDNARHRLVGQLNLDGFLLGVDQPLLFSLDRLPTSDRLSA
jgi:NADH:ubiquinone oxidoreductase subunit 4 (subunit M)